MPSPTTPMPDVLSALHQLEFDYRDGEGIDFEPFAEFLSEAETQDWIQAWTGNKTLMGKEYRVFGQDGSGGYVRPQSDLLAQPIVFFGSEGDLGVVAANFSDYLWVLAAGQGPFEVVVFEAREARPHPEFTAFAQQHATPPQRSLSEIVIQAQAEFPDFASGVQALCG
jgi:hypothetical protein